jgi:hypothetical protein
VTKKLRLVVQRELNMSMMDGWGMKLSAKEFDPITMAGDMKKGHQTLDGC